MKVLITEAAYADLLHIGRTIQADNPARAVTFVDELNDRCQRLVSMPLAFPMMPDWEASGLGAGHTATT